MSSFSRLSIQGDDAVAGVDPGVTTFVNHGCNGTYNIGWPLPLTEETAPLGAGPAAAGYAFELYPYDPFSARQFPSWECTSTNAALRDIEAGEELLDNYLVFGGSESDEEWERQLVELKELCSGSVVGLIKAYEDDKIYATRQE